ncbi:head-tail adaptor protein [Streptococcus equi subsp. equi]|nr:head-tail adaptor protein [Streptococcus equi subsp. equi]
MITRKMNVRITIFSQSGGQNEDGEVVSAVRKDLYTCWAEVLKTQLRDFNYHQSIKTLAICQQIRILRFFLIRYNPAGLYLIKKTLVSLFVGKLLAF